MTPRSGPCPYSLGEEIAHSVTHGLGAVLSGAGLMALVGAALEDGDPRRVVASAVFGTSLVLLYGASTLYHAIPQPRAKGVLQRLDHAAIFLLIAGSYTPFALVSLRGPVGWSLLVGIWALAGLGVARVAAPPRGRLRGRRLNVFPHR